MKPALADTVIEVRDVTRTFSLGDVEVQALRGVNLAVRRGEFVAIMGSSGSGKSTLMSILGCLDRPSGGTFQLEGVDVARLSEPELARIRSERLGFVFQSFNLLPRTPAIENVALPLIYAARGPRSRAERTARARAMLQRLGLGERERNTSNQLSGGQQQRVAIARALINDPAILLADEPTGNLDTRTAADIMRTLATLNQERGLTVVIVTHNAEIAAFARRVVTMRDGLIVSDERNTAPAPTGPADGTAARFDMQAQAAVDGGAAFGFGGMILSAALQALARNKMRSALTMLGVFIGVAALIAMVAMGQGANAAVRKQIEGLGTNMVIVLPGALTSGGARGATGSASSLTVADAEAIAREDPAVATVGYVIRQGAQVQYGGANWTTNVLGVSTSYPDMANWEIASGRGLSVEDEADAASVAVIGRTVRDQLFGPGADPVGAILQVKGTPVRVVGLFVSKGQSMIGQDQDDVVMIPFSTAERRVLGVAAPSAAPAGWAYLPPANPFGIQPRLTGFVNVLFMQSTGPDQVQTAIDQATRTLARRHHVQPGDDNDFMVRNLSQIADMAKNSGRIMALLLAVLASISLVVGGIGIMNILLVSVTERTREIGLRMSIGARRLQVLLQFLAEAVLLSVIGGLAGIAAGVAASLIIAKVTGWPVGVSPIAAAGGFLFSALVGMFFGFYPARRASMLDPIQALHFE